MDNKSGSEQENQLIHQFQQMFEQNMETDPYPLYPNYGKILRYEDIPVGMPEQRQLHQPGAERLMVPRPIIENPHYKGSDKLLLHSQKKVLMLPLHILMSMRTQTERNLELSSWDNVVC